MKRLMIFLGMSVLGSSLSFANPCDEDVEKVCGHNQTGTGRVADCLSSKKDELSHPCRQWMEKMDRALRDLKVACGVPAYEYCRNVRPGFQRVKNCLMSNYDKLAPDCQNALNAIGN